MLLVIIALLVAAGPTLAGDESVVFSEIMWMGSTGSTADEWIELHNRSEAAVNLEGWVVTRMTSEGERFMLEIEGGIVPPRDVFLIANFSPDDPRSRLAVTPDLIVSAIALSNSKLQLRLYDGDPSSGGTVVDVADDGSGPRWPAIPNSSGLWCESISKVPVPSPPIGTPQPSRRARATVPLSWELPVLYQPTSTRQLNARAQRSDAGAGPTSR